MKTKTKTISLFQFHELGQSAQYHAHDEYLTHGMVTDYSSVIDDAKLALSFLGVEVDHVWFSGFSSQGDGACFEGAIRAYPSGGLAKLKQEFPTDAELHELAKNYVSALANDFYKVRGKVKHSGHYYHSGCTSFELYNVEDNYRAIHEDDVISALRAFMDHIYAKLEAYYDHEALFSTFKELWECNEWHFTAAGVMDNE